MEIFEAAPKKQQGRPQRGERGGQSQRREERAAPKPQGGTALRVEKPVPVQMAKPAVRPERPGPRPVQTPLPPVPPPPPPALRKISSEPPRMGRLVAFADGRRSGRGRRRSQGR